jgi:hypothetical protein
MFRNLVRQNHKKLPQVIAQYGCNFRCLQAIAEMEAERLLSADEIIRLYEEASASGILGAQCFVNDNDAVIRQTADYLRIKTPVPRYYGEMQPDMLPAGGDFYVRFCWQTTGSYLHYTLGTVYGEIFDPFNALNADYRLIKTKLRTVRLFA